MTEIEQVGVWRSKGYGWQAVSNMLGQPMDTVRRNYDPSYSALFVAHPAPERPAKAPSGKPRPKPRPTHLDAWEALKQGERIRLIMDTLYSATLPVPMNQLGGYSAANTILHFRKRYGADIIGSKQNHGYWLTSKGREVYREHFEPKKRAVAA